MPQTQVKVKLTYSAAFNHQIGEHTFQVSKIFGVPGHQRYAIAKSQKTGKYWIAEYSDSSWVGSNREGWDISGTPTVSLIGTDHNNGQDAIN